MYQSRPVDSQEDTGGQTDTEVDPLGAIYINLTFTTKISLKKLSHSTQQIHVETFDFCDNYEQEEQTSSFVAQTVGGKYLSTVTPSST